ncbi:alcohol dehydrogenase catalytic domain-containing protein [Dermatobacter hominis]|uniref:alcohol dehydrogenase catalytic domain-containing protein n=1 Tax=Dermatobacter hominis TaxID=2884263 RepID=UPI001D116D6C|nr:alcohol dehydrogenase catalytic domain-containing protein [Dermatobacter hominis]UDY37819.1 alcohol dehydrogenase catalytic domain-containing protein [Dermatobacter hominis]
MRAIVWDGKAASVESDIQVRDLRPGEVRVRIESAGLCHSDVSVLNGTIMFPPPVVLGHEGAGEIVAVAPDVTNVAVGDHVVLSTLGNCGQCAACDSGKPTFCRVGQGKLSRPFTKGEGEDVQKVFQFANLGVFCEETVVKATQAVKIPDDVPLASASLIGCGVLTGVGAVFNRAKVQHGESVVVIGVGGIGLNVIQGAALSDALPVIAVDTNPAKESYAKLFGATHFICPDGPDFDLVEAVKEICPNGVDYVFECVGSTALIKTSTDLLDWGGTVVMLGVPKMGSEASFVVSTMYNDKTIMGCRYGSARPQFDIPLMVKLYQAGRLKLDELVSQTYPLEDFQKALDELHDGKLARGVLTVPA